MVIEKTLFKTNVAIIDLFTYHRFMTDQSSELPLSKSDVGITEALPPINPNQEAAEKFLTYYERKPITEVLGYIPDIPEDKLPPEAKNIARQALLDKLTRSLFDPQILLNEQGLRKKVDDLKLPPDISQEVQERLLKLTSEQSEKQIQNMKAQPISEIVKKFMATYSAHSPEKLEEILAEISDDILTPEARAKIRERISQKIIEDKQKISERDRELQTNAQKDAENFLQYYKSKAPHEILEFVDSIPNDKLSPYAKARVKEILSQSTK